MGPSPSGAKALLPASARAARPQAAQALDALERQLPERRDDLRAVREALHQGRLPAYPLTQLARLSEMAPDRLADAFRLLDGIVGDLRMAGHRAEATRAPEVRLTVWKRRFRHPRRFLLGETRRTPFRGTP